MLGWKVKSDRASEGLGGLKGLFQPARSGILRGFLSGYVKQESADCLAAFGSVRADLTCGFSLSCRVRSVRGARCERQLDRSAGNAAPAWRSRADDVAAPVSRGSSVIASLPSVLPETSPLHAPRWSAGWCFTCVSENSPRAGRI